MNAATPGLIAALIAAMTATLCPADDFATLLKQSHPSTSYARHTPNFSIRNQTFTMHAVDETAWKAASYADPAPIKEVKQTFTIIMDGDKFVALYDQSMGQLDLITFNPDRTSTDLKMPPRYHWGSMFGTRIQTIPWAYGWAPTGQKRDISWSAGGATLTLIEKQEWLTKDNQTRAKSLHTVTLKTDPILGYVVTIDADYATRDGNKRNPELSNIVPKGLSDPFNPQFDRLVYSEALTDKYLGYNNNCYIGEFTNKNQPIKIRNDGFIAWLRSQRETEKWGVAISRSDLGKSAGLAAVTFNNPTCNVWLDQHNCIDIPDVRGSDGLFHSLVRFTINAVPPETSDLLASQTAWADFAGRKKVMIRVDNEDFEDQPLPVSSAVRGACMLQGDLTISDTQAHSGKKSLEVTAQSPDKPIGKYDFFLGAPQLNLDSNATYRLECWIKVIGDDTAGYVVADFYDNSPHDDHRYKKNHTDSVHTKDGWKKVTLDLPTGPMAPQMDLKFVADGTGKAYFDDFSVRKLNPDPVH